MATSTIMTSSSVGVEVFRSWIGCLLGLHSPSGRVMRCYTLFTGQSKASKHKVRFGQTLEVRCPSRGDALAGRFQPVGSWTPQPVLCNQRRQRSINRNNNPKPRRTASRGDALTQSGVRIVQPESQDIKITKPEFRFYWSWF